MDGCERCTPSWQAGKEWADCDLLDTYSYLCYQMPGVVHAHQVAMSVQQYSTQRVIQHVHSSVC